MRVYISAVMEGVIRVTHSQDVITGPLPVRALPRVPNRQRECRHRRGPPAVAANGFLVNGAHDGMRNVRLEELDPRAEIIVGQRKPLSMMQGFEGADVVFFGSYHVRAGTKGVISHTFDSPTMVPGLELNGEPCSEARVNATLAGLQGIPVGLVTGDDLACEETEALHPGVQTTHVETVVDRCTARCLSPEATHRRIRGAAASGGVDLVPYTPEPPYSFVVEFATASAAVSVLFFSGLEHVDYRCVFWTHEHYETSFKMLIGVMRLARSDPDYR